MQPPPREDPAVRHARREAIVALLTFVIAAAYSVTYCYRNGYDRPIESLTFVLGFPDWVFWGVIVPWLACSVVSYWVSFHFFVDDKLGEDHDIDVAEGSRGDEETQHG